jgi:hypothetical protein
LSRRKRRPVLSRRVAIGENPVRAVTKAMLELPVGKGEVWDVGIAHDCGCPTLRRGGLRECDCEVVRLDARRVA